MLPGPPDLALARAHAADFTGDQLPDLIGVSTEGVVFAAGNGDGSFAPSNLILELPERPLLVSGDLDGDGVRDLAGWAASSGVFALRGNGDGTFEPAVTTPLTADNADAIVVGDFDDDGHLDVAASSSGVSPTVEVLFGLGNHTFDAGNVLSTNGSPNITTVVLAADIDGDGDDDLIYSDYFAPGITVFRSNGDRAFATGQLVVLDGNAGVGALAAADFNADGKVDVALAHYHPSSGRLLLSNGDGSFHTASSFATGFKGQAIAVGDYNRDGVQDAITSDGQSLFVALGNAPGSLDASTQLEVPFGADGLQSADFDNDGILDLALGIDLEVGRTAIVRGDGHGAFDVAPVPVDPVKSIGVGDFDKDGNLDVVTVPPVDSSGLDPAELHVRRGNGDGTFVTATVYATGAVPSTVRVDDVDGDTWLDLVTSNAHDVSVFLNRKDGTFAPAQSTLPVAASERHLGMELLHLDSDGKIDIAIAREMIPGVEPRLDVALGTGKGAFGTPTEYTLRVGANALATGDVDNDGTVDLVTGFPLDLFLSAGNGTLTASTVFDGGGVLQGGAVLADVTNDGNLDLFASSADLQVHEGNGDGTFDAPRLIAHYPIGNPELVVDINQDGVLDIITNGEVRTIVILGRSDGTYGAPLIYRTGLSPWYDRSVAADLDGNGLLDLATPGGILLQRGCTAD